VHDSKSDVVNITAVLEAVSLQDAMGECFPASDATPLTKLDTVVYGWVDTD